MVNTRRKRHGAASRTSKQRPKHWKGKPAGLSTASSLQSLPLQYPTIPSRPSPPPPNHEVTELLLETLNAHQVATKRRINPENDIKNHQQLGTSVYILQLVMEVERTLARLSESTLSESTLSESILLESTLMLQQRVERIQVYYGLKECPQNERPKPKTSTALIEPQSYNQPSTNYTSPGLDELPIDALFFTWRAFGHLFHRLPPMGGEESSQSSLSSLYLEVKCAWEFGSLLHTYASIPFKRPDQASTPRHKPCPPQLAELNSDPPTDASHREQPCVLYDR